MNYHELTHGVVEQTAILLNYGMAGVKFAQPFNQQ